MNLKFDYGNKKMAKSKLAQLQNELDKIKFHNSCLLYLIGELKDNKKLKSPTMQEECILFDLSSRELRFLLQHILEFNGDFDDFIKNALANLHDNIDIGGLFVIIKGIKNSTYGKTKKNCKKLLKHHKKLNGKS